MTRFPDPRIIAELMREIAADKILPRFRKLGEDEVRSKTSPTDLVTIADVESEAALRPRLMDLLPGSLVLGEEGVSAGSDSVEDLLSRSDTPLWIVDPVDGTSNFVQGKTTFALMIALLWNGEPVQSWILDIPADRIGIAELGSGAYLEDRGTITRMHTAPDKPTADLTGHVGRKFFAPDYRAHFDATLPSAVASAKSLQCAGHEYLKICTGESDFSLYGLPKPWDHAPGALMLREAGGVSDLIEGSGPYRPSETHKMILNASSPEVWARMRDVLTPPAA